MEKNESESIFKLRVLHVSVSSYKGSSFRKWPPYSNDLSVIKSNWEFHKELRSLLLQGWQSKGYVFSQFKFWIRISVSPSRYHNYHLMRKKKKIRKILLSLPHTYFPFLPSWYLQGSFITTFRFFHRWPATTARKNDRNF